MRPASAKPAACILALAQPFLKNDDPGHNALFHHYEAGRGRAGYSCTGCNLQTLVCIYRCNVLMGNRKPPDNAYGQKKTERLEP